MLCLCGPDRLHRCQEKKECEALKGRLREKENKKTMFEKKTYALIVTTAMTLLAIASCAKLSTDAPYGGEQVPVTFSTYGMRPTGTKADAGFVAPGGDFAVGAVVGVYGFYHDNTNWADETAAGENIADFMYHTALTKQEDGSWSYSPIKYWPNEYGTGANSTNVDRLSFWAYYPRNAAGLSLNKSTTANATANDYDNDTNGLPWAHFEVNPDITKQVDLMFTEPLTDLYKSQEHAVDGGDTDRYGFVPNGQVTLKLRHALSLVQFNVVSDGGSLPADAEIVVTDLTLTNIKTKGDCTVPSASFASDAAAETYWSNVSTPVDMVVPTEAAGSYGSMLVLLPQTLEQDGSTSHSLVKLTLTYDIRFPAAHNPAEYISYSDNTAEKYLWADGAGAYGVKRWLPGRRYVYNLEAGLEKIEFSEVTEESWIDEWPE